MPVVCTSHQTDAVEATTCQHAPSLVDSRLWCVDLRVCVRMSVRACICVGMRPRICACACMYVRVRMSDNPCVYICMSTRICSCLRLFGFIRVRASMPVVCRCLTAYSCPCVEMCPPTHLDAVLVEHGTDPEVPPHVTQVPHHLKGGLH